MTAVLDDATADPWQIIADLQRKLDASIAELAQRNSEYGERIEQQSATIDVLKVMSASPGGPQPVFDLIDDDTDRLSLAQQRHPKLRAQIAESRYHGRRG